MLKDLSNDFRIEELSETTISNQTFTEVLNSSARGWLDCIVFAITDTNMKLIIEIDGVNIINEFLLKDFNSKYGLEKKVDYSLPFSSIDDKTFKYQPRNFQQFNSSIKIKLKHEGNSSNKKLSAGYISYQSRQSAA